METGSGVATVRELAQGLGNCFTSDDFPDETTGHQTTTALCSTQGGSWGH